MEAAVEFQKKLAAVLEEGRKKGDQLDRSEVVCFFEAENLTEEQLNMVCDYLLSQKVKVSNYRKTEVVAEIVLTEEEERYLQQYEEDVALLPDEDILKNFLPQIIRMAKELYHAEVFLGDLIQEGNMGLLLGMSQDITEAEVLLEMARESMQTLVENQVEVKRQDQKMADKVNDLDEKITKLTEEMGRKVSVDELAELLEVEEDEIMDLIHLAGEELEDEKEQAE